MAKRPWILTNEQQAHFISCDNLDDFENTMHEYQKDYIYTASPYLSKDPETDKILALYMLLDEAGGFFPINPQIQLYMGGYQADEILVRFIANKKRLGVCSYAKFMDYMLRHGVKHFDANTVDIPEMSEETMVRILREIE